MSVLILSRGKIMCRLFNVRTNMIFSIIVFIIISTCKASTKTILMTEVFEIPIAPPMFNWTYDYEGVHEKHPQFHYTPSLLDAPDLPSWISYTYSNQHHAGLLYGVPPSKHDKEIFIEIIALNRKTYETRRHIITIRIAEKRGPAKHQVQLKIVNLNVEDMFDEKKMTRLKDIFQKRLWKDSQDDLYITFLQSAVQLGARLPLDPTEREGVVIKLGSKAPLSTDLIELEKEVRPLWKLPVCPRDFKRTTVEIYFREADFVLDWCAFRLLNENKSPIHHSEMNIEQLANIGEQRLIGNRWESITKSEVPQRSYVNEFMFSVLIPLFFMAALASLLTLTLCFHHEGVKDEISEEFFDNVFHICTDYVRSKHADKSSTVQCNQYATIHRATHSARSLSNTRDITCASPESALTSRSHTNSPTSTISRGVHCRPSPPPYVRPKHKPGF